MSAATRGHREEHLDLCAALVVGSLGDAERAELEAHLAEGCATCEAVLRSLAGGATVLALSVAQHRAPAAARERVLEAFARERGGVLPGDAGSRRTAEITPLPPRDARSGADRPAFATWALAAAAVLLAVAGVFSWQQVEGLRRQLASVETRMRALQKAYAEERRWAGLLEAPGTRVVQLAGTGAGSPSLAAQVLYDPDSDRAIVVAERFARPSDRDYELWAITASGPTSLGLVRADASGRAVVRVEGVSRDGAVAAFAVSLEATGGSPDHHKPSGPVVMLGKLSG
jgi:hypothetical protein